MTATLMKFVSLNKERKNKLLINSTTEWLCTLQNTYIHTVILRLNNEVSKYMISVIEVNSMQCQIPSFKYRRLNLAECAIQKLKK